MYFTRKRLTLYLAALLVLQLFTCISTIRIVRPGYIDLRSFYTAGYMVRTGSASSLYNYSAEQRLQSALVTRYPRALPMMPPAFVALAFVPLSLLSFWKAYFVFLAVNLLILALSATLLLPYLGSLRQRWGPAPFLLFLSFLPAAIALMMGQLSLALLLIYCLAFIALRSHTPFLAGLLVSLGLMKFQVALPVAFLFLLWRQWAFFAGFLGGTAGLTALTAFIIGARNLRPYLHSLVFMTSSISPDPLDQFKYAILPTKMPNLYGLLFSLTHGAHWTPILTTVASVLLFLWAAFQRPSLPFALLVGLLVSYHLYLYDLTLLLLPLSLILQHEFAASDHSKPPPIGSHPWRSWITWRRLVQISALSILLIAPLERALIAWDLMYLLAVPMLALAFVQTGWPALTTSPKESESLSLSYENESP